MDIEYFRAEPECKEPKQGGICGGKHTNPLNLDSVNIVERNYRRLIFEYFEVAPKSIKILNNGHTVVVRLEYAAKHPSIMGGPLDGIYIFEQLQFYWFKRDGVDDEDHKNKVLLPPELHMIFRNMKYQTLDEAAMQSKGLAILAYAYEITENDNLFYKEITEQLSHITKPHTETKFYDEIDLWCFINIGMEYYTYIGSLTTPPCSEEVIWLDFEEPTRISVRQVERFHRLYSIDNTQLPTSFPRLQPLNNRTVLYVTLQDYSDEDDLEIPSAIPFVDNLIGGASMRKPIEISFVVTMLLLSLLTTKVAAFLMA
ncbi:PREDICTED: carbonic anhydrase 7-like [Rhagoletis zephyria]|uniref:carbonic anhydrase 7-like n=1 Tax=Rhagoletis zephyria TaxID=28612 RepID=UPI0008112A0A|nr:PREDICTED: carbonic anhydrase 7-like [Rhagoletis zephyria]